MSDISASNVTELPVRPVRTVPSSYMNLYPAKDSLVEAIAYIEGQLPLTHPNQLFPLLMLYHNTLLKELGLAQQPTFH